MYWLCRFASKWQTEPHFLSCWIFNCGVMRKKLKILSINLLKKWRWRKFSITLTAVGKIIKFSTDVHERTKLRVIRIREEILKTLEENQVQLQNMLSSMFVGYFLNDVTKWQNLFSNSDQVICSWMEVQRKWMYLDFRMILGCW